MRGGADRFRRRGGGGLSALGGRGRGRRCLPEGAARELRTKEDGHGPEEERAREQELRVRGRESTRGLSGRARLGKRGVDGCAGFGERVRRRRPGARPRRARELPRAAAGAAAAGAAAAGAAAAGTGRRRRGARGAGGRVGVYGS
jgi:hypothetical protein